MNSHIQTIKDLEHEIDSRGKRIRDILREKEANELKNAEEVAQLQNELDIKKEHVVTLQSKADLIEVYKKKIENMAQLQ